MINPMKKPQKPSSLLPPWHTNQLWLYRKRMAYSQKRVACLLGHASTTHLSEYERGRRLPSLETALRLEIILRMPMAFLYTEMYNRMKRQIRQAEDQLNALHQDE